MLSRMYVLRVAFTLVRQDKDVVCSHAVVIAEYTCEWRNVDKVCIRDVHRSGGEVKRALLSKHARSVSREAVTSRNRREGSQRS